MVIPYSNGYSYRRPLTIDHTKVVGGANLSNFTMYFKVVSADLKSVANGGHVVNGTYRDFRLEISGSKIQHEITRYDPTTGSVEGWCLIPTLLGASGTVIYMYYGKTLGATEEDPSAVWASSGWADLVHMADGGYSSISESDRFTAVNISGAVNTNDSPVGSGYTFDGVNDYIDLGNYGRWATRPITIQFWAKNTKSGGYSVPFSSSNMNSPYEGYHARFENSANAYMTTQTGNNTGGGPGNRNSATGSVANTIGNWDLWTIQFQAHNDVRIFKNGVEDTSESYSGTATTIAYAAFSSTSRSSFGRNFVSDQYFGGAMAEFKLRNAAPPFSSNYMRTEYNNQSNYAAFFTTGSEEKTDTIDQVGSAHIARIESTTQAGNARIQRTENITQQGNARIRRTESATQQGDARIQRTESTTQTGNARLQRTESISQIGNATLESFFFVTSIDQTGNARIERTLTTTQQGNARIERVRSTDQVGSAHIERMESTSQTGNATLYRIDRLDQVGNATIEKDKTINQIGNATIIRQDSLQQIGNARILRTESIIQLGNAAVIRIDQLTQVGNARIERVTSTIIIGNAQITNPTPDKRPQEWEDASTEQPAEWSAEDRAEQMWDNTEDKPETPWQNSQETQEQQWSDGDNKQPAEWRRQFYD